MRRGFTILELLVAALLLGMLVTVLTMIFNQSSIAWRTGVAGLLDMDEVRDNVSAVRDEADCIYVWNNKVHRTLSIWDEKSGGDGKYPPLKCRAIDDENYKGKKNLKDQLCAWELGFVQNKTVINISSLQSDSIELRQAIGPVDVKQSESQAGRNWIVNVKSSGPNGVLNDYDDIWSNPDDFE